MFSIILLLAGCNDYSIRSPLQHPSIPGPDDEVAVGIVLETDPPVVPADSDDPTVDPPLPPDTDTDTDTDTVDTDLQRPVETDTDTDLPPPVETDTDTDLPPPVETDTDLPPLVDTAPPVPPDCDSDTRKVLVEEVFFPERTDCAWYDDGNLGRRNEHNQAQAVDRHEVRLPEGATLCALSIASVTSDLRFDDHFVLTLDDWVLVSGGSGFSQAALEEVDGLYRYDWELLKGTPFAGRYEPYWCLGQPESRCTVPRTEEKGRLDLELGGDELERLTDEMLLRSDLPVALRVFGDDDAGDCSHSDVRLKVTVEYVGGP